MDAANRIEEAAALLRRGELVALPTETVYGLGADAFNAAAVAKVFEAKGRPHFDPLIVHVAAAVEVDRVARDVPAAARRLAEAFWPGPMTLVLPKAHRVPALVTAGLDTVGVRVPDHPLATQLIRAAATPVAAPSANTFGGISPTRAGHVSVPCAMVLDGGPCRMGVESTVLRVADDGSVMLLRAGGLALEAVEALLGTRIEAAVAGDALASPGMLERHYAPRTPLTLVDRLSDADLCAREADGARLGLLCLGELPRHSGSFAARAVLSASGDLSEAAANLFEALHRLDAAGLDRIIAQRVPEEGLGRAINDRLRRAAVD